MNCYFWLKKTYSHDYKTNKNKTTRNASFDFEYANAIFFIIPCINPAKEGKLLLGVTSFEATNSVFNITDENKSFSITTPGHWSPGSEEIVKGLSKVSLLRSQIDIELYVQ